MILVESKTINKKQGVGLLYVGLATLVSVISINMPKSYGWINDRNGNITFGYRNIFSF